LSSHKCCLKLQEEKPSGINRKHSALSNIKILHFFCGLFALQDPDPADHNPSKAGTFTYQRIFTFPRMLTYSGMWDLPRNVDLLSNVDLLRNGDLLRNVDLPRKVDLLRNADLPRNVDLHNS
jgi:hypothetical protein